MAWFRCIENNKIIEPRIEQGETIKTSGYTANVLSGKYYLFSTVYGGQTFSGANLIIGDTSPIYIASGIGRIGCIIESTSNIITYNRSGEISSNEYTELNIINGNRIIGIGATWNNGTSITTQKNDNYLIALGDGETGDIIGADIWVEHKLVDTVSNGTRFLIVKATGNTISLDSENIFYYRKIEIST